MERERYLDDLSFCGKLTNLTLNNCDLEHFPLVICDLKNLRELSIDKSHIKLVPSDVIKLVNLESFTLTRCKKFIKFPQQICKLKCLKRLTFRNCGIKKIPNKIYKLQNLEHLCLSNNKLETLPSS